jgi:hypothetical protein
MNNGVPVIGQEDPRRQQKAVFRPHAGEGVRQTLEITLFQSCPAWQQIHRHKDRSVEQKGPAQTRHGDYLRARPRACKD